MIVQLARDDNYTSLPLFGELVFKENGRIRVENTQGNVLIDCTEKLWDEMIKRGYIEE